EGGVGQQKLFGGVVIAVAQLGSPQVVHFAQGLLGQTLQGFFRGNTLFFSEGVGVFQQPLYLIRMQLPVVGVDVEGGGSALCASDGTQGGAGDHAQSLLYRCGQGWVFEQAVQLRHDARADQCASGAGQIAADCAQCQVASDAVFAAFGPFQGSFYIATCKRLALLLYGIIGPCLRRLFAEFLGDGDVGIQFPLYPIGVEDGIDASGGVAGAHLGVASHAANTCAGDGVCAVAVFGIAGRARGLTGVVLGATANAG